MSAATKITPPASEGEKKYKTKKDKKEKKARKEKKEKLKKRERRSKSSAPLFSRGIDTAAISPHNSGIWSKALPSPTRTKQLYDPRPATISRADSSTTRTKSTIVRSITSTQSPIFPQEAPTDADRAISEFVARIEPSLKR
jgi:hypothetical protein